LPNPIDICRTHEISLLHMKNVETPEAEVRHVSRKTKPGSYKLKTHERALPYVPPLDVEDDFIDTGDCVNKTVNSQDIPTHSKASNFQSHGTLVTRAGSVSKVPRYLQRDCCLF